MTSPLDISKATDVHMNTNSLNSVFCNYPTSTFQPYSQLTTSRLRSLLHLGDGLQGDTENGQAWPEQEARHDIHSIL